MLETQGFFFSFQGPWWTRLHNKCTQSLTGIMQKDGITILRLANDSFVGVDDVIVGGFGMIAVVEEYRDVFFLESVYILSKMRCVWMMNNTVVVLSIGCYRDEEVLVTREKKKQRTMMYFFMLRTSFLEIIIWKKLVYCFFKAQETTMRPKVLYWLIHLVLTSNRQALRDYHLHHSKDYIWDGWLKITKICIPNKITHTKTTHDNTKTTKQQQKANYDMM